MSCSTRNYNRKTHKFQKAKSANTKKVRICTGGKGRKAPTTGRAAHGKRCVSKSTGKKVSCARQRAGKKAARSRRAVGNDSWWF